MIGELTSTRPLPNSERTARWYAKAARNAYPLFTGPRWGQQAREYERQQMQDAEPVDPGYEH
jgi:hypothetical protein